VSCVIAPGVIFEILVLIMFLVEFPEGVKFNQEGIVPVAVMPTKSFVLLAEGT
jgi:hypothetical protein